MNPTPPLCVFRCRTGWLALEAPLVGEVADLGTITPLAGCRPGILGLANLRGRAVAAVDLDFLLGGPEGDPPAADLRCLVLRLPGREAAAPILKVEGVFAANPAHRREVNRLAEPPWISTFHAFPGLRDDHGGELVAAVIDPHELAQRLDTLRFAPVLPAAAGTPSQRQGS